MWFTRIKASSGLLLLASLLACAPVTKHWDPTGYTVQSGDTLYSIAWRYEKDFRDLARWNRIKSPYAIYPGQRLKMSPDSAAGTIDHEDKQPLLIESQTGRKLEGKMVGEPEPESQVKPVAPPMPEYWVVREGDTLYSISRKLDIPVHKLSRWNALKRDNALYPGQKLRLRPPQISRQPVRTEKKLATGTRKSPVKPAPAKLPAKVSRWYWPTRGKLVKTFNRRDTSRKGIGIAGNRGQPVKATAAGQVVYSGNGLISYGNLVIIKHSNAFLSAYAHNQKLLVKEGDRVKAGQVIAKMGSPGNGRAQLHFEIRKNGKPVNPLKYLP